MSNLKEVEAEAFKKWFLAQRTYGSLSAMERALGITKDYLHQIRDGTRRATDPELRKKLREATGLRAFEPITTASDASVATMASANGTLRAASTSSTLDDGLIPENLPTLLNLAIKRLGLTLAACSQKYGMSLSVLKKYKSGVRKPGSEKNTETILRILNDAGIVTSKENRSADVKVRELPANTRVLIRELKELGEKVDQMDAKLTAARMYQETGRQSVSTNAKEKAKTVMRLLSSLSSELEFFKNCTEDERATFRKTIPGEDIGYITTLLRALYDEDKFQRWLFFSKYVMKGNDDSE